MTPEDEAGTFIDHLLDDLEAAEEAARDVAHALVVATRTRVEHGPVPVQVACVDEKHTGMSATTQQSAAVCAGIEKNQRSSSSGCHASFSALTNPNHALLL